MLILFLGGELFTSNVMIMSLGLLAKKTNLFDMLRIWGIAIISNYAGLYESRLGLIADRMRRRFPSHLGNGHV